MQHMQQELERLRSSERELRSKLRDIELDNDDLEKSERAISSTLSDVEWRYNKAIERTALLENELVDKARMEEELQRIKDELRENMEELAVMESARSEALANAACAIARLHELENRLAPETAAVSASVTKYPATPRRVLESDGTAASWTVPSPDIDNIDEDGSGMHPNLAMLAGNDSSQEVTQTSLTQAVTGNLSSTKRASAMTELRNSFSPAMTREKKSEGIINDMRGLTLRMQTMSKSLNTRRESLMAGSAIPRPTPRKSAVILHNTAANAVPEPRRISSHTLADSSTSPHKRPSSGIGKGATTEHSFQDGVDIRKSSRPVSRLSYGTGARKPAIPSTSSRPTTPAQGTQNPSTARGIRRVSLEPASMKRRSRLAGDKPIPPLPATPGNGNLDTPAKRLSLASSVRRPTAPNSQPAWR